MEETWKSVIKYEGIYEISNLGRVKRILGGRGATPGYILKPQMLKTGYFAVRLCANGKPKTMYIHRLVAEAFIGSCPPNYQANHKNGIKEDNRLENIEWVTPSQNSLHACRVLGRVRQGEQTGNAKLTDEQVIKIRQLHKTGSHSQSKLARLFNVSPCHICNIIHYRKWKHI